MLKLISSVNEIEKKNTYDEHPTKEIRKANIEKLSIKL